MKLAIYMPCPVCLQQGYNSVREYWRHDWPCKGELFLDEYAIVHCSKCRRKEHLTKMKLRCGNDRHNFAVSSVTGFASAISTSAQFVERAGLAWLQSAIEYLGK